MYMTGFADEAAKGIDGQIKATLELGWRNIESRAVDGVNIHDLDDTAFDIVYGKLQDAGISWQVYQNMADNFTDNPLAGFRAYRNGWFDRPGHSAALKARGISTRDLDLLRADVLANRLPQVSFIIATAWAMSRLLRGSSSRM